MGNERAAIIRRALLDRLNSGAEIFTAYDILTVAGISESVLQEALADIDGILVGLASGSQ